MSFDMNPRDDEPIDREVYEQNEAYRSDPTKHEFVVNCDPDEAGWCWLCGQRAAIHKTVSK
jgi:hypothetical protein